MTPSFPTLRSSDLGLRLVQRGADLDRHGPNMVPLVGDAIGFTLSWGREAEKPCAAVPFTTSIQTHPGAGEDKSPACHHSERAGLPHAAVHRRSRHSSDRKSTRLNSSH